MLCFDLLSSLNFFFNIYNTFDMFVYNTDLAMTCTNTYLIKITLTCPYRIKEELRTKQQCVGIFSVFYFADSKYINKLWETTVSRKQFRIKANTLPSGLISHIYTHLHIDGSHNILQVFFLMSVLKILVEWKHTSQS